MANSNLLKSIMVAQGYTVRDVAKGIGINEKRLYRYMKKGIFPSDVVEQLVKFLDIVDPVPIFFTGCVTREVTHE